MRMLLWLNNSTKACVVAGTVIFPGHVFWANQEEISDEQLVRNTIKPYGKLSD